ncbi:glutamate racemase [Leuconostoc kimchii IMSNU 11154]|uniref:Glutamate racemase n=1 Tax=Leuconostoc kimchii (strain IMSNU 11154 / KCTC 2386 / IH25) TaxID=762051 RepID=D5T597_LEUKI|nr:glutamate racemase [Leuconostoc kimchii]ADG41227.1 glutamate racemase [Leuconostoc kimchii IMSNU 11154]
MNKNNPIGMVDSGVGGLTVIKAAQKQLPNEQFIFIGDTARMPYGPRTTDEVIAYTLQMANFLVNEKHIKLLVIACNTATARALSVLQDQLSIPVIGVIQPGAKAAQLATKNKKIGVIATQGTVTSEAYDVQLHHYNSQITVVSQAEPEFVQTVELNKYHSDEARKLVNSHLATLKAAKIDTLILGCTHFPLLTPFIKSAIGENVTLIDSGQETVQVIQDCLAQSHLSTVSKHDHNDDVYYTTGDPVLFKAIATDWLEREKTLDVRQLKIVDAGTQQHLEE